MATAVELATSEVGAGEPLVILHGLFGSKRNWSSIAGRLAEHRRVITVDMRNHGESPWDDLHDYPQLADDAAPLIGEPRRHRTQRRGDRRIPRHPARA